VCTPKREAKSLFYDQKAGESAKTSESTLARQNLESLCEWACIVA
jgi:hypothetical protein